jgi:hypothetical protein
MASKKKGPSLEELAAKIHETVANIPTKEESLAKAERTLSAMDFFKAASFQPEVNAVALLADVPMPETIPAMGDAKEPSFPTDLTPAFQVECFTPPAEEKPTPNVSVNEDNSFAPRDPLPNAIHQSELSKNLNTSMPPEKQIGPEGEINGETTREIALPSFSKFSIDETHPSLRTYDNKDFVHPFVADQLRSGDQETEINTNSLTKVLNTNEGNILSDLKIESNVPARINTYFESGNKNRSDIEPIFSSNSRDNLRTNTKNRSEIEPNIGPNPRPNFVPDTENRPTAGINIDPINRTDFRSSAQNSSETEPKIELIPSGNIGTNTKNDPKRTRQNPYLSTIPEAPGSSEDHILAKCGSFAMYGYYTFLRNYIKENGGLIRVNGWKRRYNVGNSSFKTALTHLENAGLVKTLSSGFNGRRIELTEPIFNPALSSSSSSGGGSSSKNIKQLQGKQDIEVTTVQNTCSGTISLHESESSDFCQTTEQEEQILSELDNSPLPTFNASRPWETALYDEYAEQLFYAAIITKRDSSSFSVQTLKLYEQISKEKDNETAFALFIELMPKAKGSPTAYIAGAYKKDAQPDLKTRKIAEQFFALKEEIRRTESLEDIQRRQKQAMEIGDNQRLIEYTKQLLCYDRMSTLIKSAIPWHELNSQCREFVKSLLYQPPKKTASK